LHIRENYPEGMVQIEENSVYGIPMPYESIFINERLNSDILSAPKIWINFYFSIKI
jgi:hypothetical protein